jgi:integrase
MFRTGLRIGECITIELSDFRRLTSADPTLHVHQTWTQKGRHERRKNVRDDCPIAYATVYGHFHGAMTAAELPKHTPHDTRHTVAVNLLDWTGNVRLVAACLGDTVQTVVRHYMDPDNEIPWKRFIGVGDRIRKRSADAADLMPAQLRRN